MNDTVQTLIAFLGIANFIQSMGNCMLSLRVFRNNLYAKTHNLKPNKNNDMFIYNYSTSPHPGGLCTCIDVVASIMNWIMTVSFIGFRKLYVYHMVDCVRTHTSCATHIS